MNRLALPMAWQAGVYQALRVFWAGGLWTAGLLVVPTLFQALDRQQAVGAATAVFRVLGVVGFFLVGSLMLLHSKVEASQGAWRALVAALLSSVLLHFCVVPMVVAHANIAVEADKQPLWHIAANVLFMTQMFCAAWVALTSIASSKRAHTKPTSEDKFSDVAETDQLSMSNSEGQR